MKIKAGFELRELAGQSIVVATGDAAKDFNGMIRLNKVGAFIWKELADGTSEQALVKAVLDRYDVDEDVVKQDIKEVLNKLSNANVLI